MSEITLAHALSPVITALEAGGYEGGFALEGDKLHFTIIAGDGACEDCLSPKVVMSRMVSNALATAGFDYDVDLTYPADALRPKP